MPYVIYDGDIAVGQFEAAVAGAVWEPDAPAVPLAIVAKEALRAIDREAERARAKYLTPGVGQGLAYQAKAAEARACLAAAAPDLADYPHLAGEIGITGATLIGVAEVIAANANAWVSVSAEIESTRLAVKAAVKAAASPAEITTILDGLTWPSPGQE